MADDIRRSGRATKGQHTKNADTAETPPPTKSKPKVKGKGSKAKAINDPSPSPDDDDKDSIIRCICGLVEEEEDEEPRSMICCDECEAWQHNECMEVTDDPDKIPEQYFCEECHPGDHKELLAKIARGEKPWEEREKQRELEEAEKKGKKRKGKKGKKGRTSEAKKEESKSNGGAAGPVASSPVQTQTPKAETGQKRKLEVETSATKEIKEPEPKSKVRKISSPVDIKALPPPPPPPARRQSTIATAPTPPQKRSSLSGVVLQTELVESVDALQSEARKKIAHALIKIFVGCTQAAQKDRSFVLPSGQSSDAFGNKLGLAVEYAMYLNFWGNATEPNPQYMEKFRTINHNVKANPELRDRLLNGSLAPNDLSKMTSQEMASKQLQEEMAKMKKDAEKQHIIVQEEGQRIRRTHKGDELVEDDSRMSVASDSVFAPAVVKRRPSEIDPNAPKQASSTAGSPTSPVPMETSDNVPRSPPAASAQPLTVDTNARPPQGLEKQPSSAFNIQQVWSSVSGPATDSHIQKAQHRQQGPQRLVQADAEIDHLLKDEEPEDEEPYSPTEYAADPNAPVWRGTLGMAIVSEFNGIAKHVAGANVSATYPWSQLMPSHLAIEGRINIERASEYLCGLRFSNTTDVCVLAVTPVDDPDAKIYFNKLFDYFSERNRYGVISKTPIPAVKDTYVIPLEAGVGKKPDFINLLEDCAIEDTIPERMLLLTFVIRSNADSQSAQATPHNNLDGGMVASPGTPAQQQYPQQFSTYPPSQTPGDPQPSTISGYQGPMHPYNGSPPQQQQGFMPPPQYQQAPPTGPIGIEAARQALGTLADVPAVGELLKEAPNTGVLEFDVIRELMENMPATRNDYKMLRDMLGVKLQQGH